MNRSEGFFLLIAFFICISGLYGQSKADFDRVIDFSVNLKELHESIEKGRTGEIDKGRLLLVNGTLADLTPKKSWFFLISERQIARPDRFLAELHSGKNPLSRLIQGKLPQETRALLEVKPLGEQARRAQLAEVVKALNDLLRKGNLASGEALQALSENSGLREIAALSPKGEELAYINRLLLDHYFADSLQPVRIFGEIVAGEWIGTEDVRSYSCVVQFSGAESFKVFYRMRVSEASSVMVPENTEVLAVVVPVSPVEVDKNRTLWLTEVLYIRRIE
jgi:hypothetical protein